MFEWTAESIGFMEDACRRMDFHKRLAGMLAPELKPTDRICDAGCGLGYLSLSLAPYAAHVTAAERDDAALAVLRRELAARGVANVTPLCTDVLTYTPAEKFDAMVFCFFGSMEEILDVARRQCRGTVLAIVRDDERHRFSGALRGPGRHSFGYACGVLDAQGVPFTARREALDFPQPFRTIADAGRFLTLYGKGETAEEDVRARLVSTGDAEFPWELPGVRHFGIVRFSMKEGENR